MHFDQIPQNLRDHPFWILWRYGKEDPNTGKRPKLPVDADGDVADPHDEGTWLEFEEAVAIATEFEGYGIGIVLTEMDNLIGIDLDDVAAWRKDAKRIINTFRSIDGSYLEKSPSGNGYRIVVRGALPKNTRTRNMGFYGGKCEVYRQERFLTITGWKATGDVKPESEPIDAEGPMQEALISFTEALRGAAKRHADGLDDPRINQEERLDDDAIVFEMAGMAQKGLPGASAFMRIWNDGFDDEEDASSSMASAMASLTTVTKSYPQIKRILMSNEHFMGYVDQRTGQPKLERWLESEAPSMIVRRVEDEIEEKEEQREAVAEARTGEYYDGDDEDLNPAVRYHYVAEDSNKPWYDRVRRMALATTSLNSLYKHIFDGSRGNPLICATLLEDPYLVKTDGLTWIPVADIDSNDGVVMLRGRPFTNTYSGFGVSEVDDVTDDDVKPWLDLVNHLCGRDKKAVPEMIKRIAFDVQFPDKKCNWHLVMLGIQGAGKDSLLTPLQSIFRDAFQFVTSNAIKSGYEDHLANSKIVTVNEASALRGSTMDELKSISTSQTNDIEFRRVNIKGGRKMLMPNLWSLYFTTNEEDALQMDRNERRFFLTRCDTVMPEELRIRYYRWLEREGGAAKLFTYLRRNVDLSDFDHKILPQRTAAFYDMVEETEYTEAKATGEMFENGELGFADGLVDINAIIKRLKNVERLRYVKKFKVANKLESLGFKPVEVRGQKKIDGKMVKKSRGYYVQEDSHILSLKKPVDVFDAIDELEKIVKGGDFIDD